MKKSISILIAICVLCASFNRCTSGKYISSSGVNELDNTQDYLVLHTKEEKYKLCQYQFTESKLKGVLKKYTKDEGVKLHVYTSLSYNKMNGDISVGDFELNRSDISKIMFKKKDVLLTSIVIAGGIVVLFLLFGGVQVTGSSF